MHRVCCALAVLGAAVAIAHAQPPAAPSADEHTLLLSHFDTTPDADHAGGSPKATVSGAQLVAAGKWGGAVSLGDDQYLSFEPEGNLDMSRGTLMFWVKPRWQAPTERSHTLLSMGLDGDPPGYFVLSQGWWESGGGAARMYFVYDNQAYMHASTARMMTQGEYLDEWHHITLTWAEGTPGHNAIYIDGDLAARTTKDCPRVRRPATPLCIGSDRGTQMSAARSANVLVDELIIYDRPFTADEIATAYQHQEPRWEQIQARAWEWLTSVLAEPEPTFARDGAGRVLESRALLDEGSGWTSQEGADERVEKMRRAGFNVFIPCVWHGRGSYWPSALEPPQEGLEQVVSDPDRDPLKYLIGACHAEGIEVHPWFCVSKRERDLHPEFVEEGTPERFFDAHRPEFRDFIVALMLDVIRRYEVDGINLDYIRTGGLCKGPKCRSEYKARFGTELLDDLARRGPDGGPNAKVVQWQNEAISDIVKRVALEGRKLRPGLIVSVDGHLKPPSAAPSTDGRNELPWIEAGWVDVVYNMDYGRMLSFATLDGVRKAIGRPTAAVALPGNYERTREGQVVPREGKLVADHIAFCRRRWPGNGVGLYLYSMLSDDQIAALRAGPFREDAVPHWVR